MTLEIVSYIPSTDKTKPLVAEFAVKIVEWDLIIHKMRLTRSSKGILFTNFPAFGVSSGSGKLEYRDMFEFPPEKKKKFLESCLKKIDEYIKANYSEKPQTITQANQAIEKQYQNKGGPLK